MHGLPVVHLQVVTSFRSIQFSLNGPMNLWVLQSGPGMSLFWNQSQLPASTKPNASLASENTHTSPSEQVSLPKGATARQDAAHTQLPRRLPMAQLLHNPQSPIGLARLDTRPHACPKPLKPAVRFGGSLTHRDCRQAATAPWLPSCSSGALTARGMPSTLTVMVAVALGRSVELSICCLSIRAAPAKYFHAPC